MLTGEVIDTNDIFYLSHSNIIVIWQMGILKKSGIGKD